MTSQHGPLRLDLYETEMKHALRRMPGKSSNLLRSLLYICTLIFNAKNSQFTFYQAYNFLVHSYWWRSVTILWTSDFIKIHVYIFCNFFAKILCLPSHTQSCLCPCSVTFPDFDTWATCKHKGTYKLASCLTSQNTFFS